MDEELYRIYQKISEIEEILSGKGDKDFILVGEQLLDILRDLTIEVADIKDKLKQGSH